jgi:hypothetical protein
MTSKTEPSEHFATLFDHRYLPCALALWRSLRRHADNAVLWALCMDTEALRILERLALPGLKAIPLAAVEGEELLAVKPKRTHGEYCWTLTPATFRMVFMREPLARRATYIDADLWFMSDPRRPLEEMAAAGKRVLITPHAFAPEYAKEGRLSGTYCVQFVCVENHPDALVISDRWAGQCRNWCSATPDRNTGRFGDQAYLEDWPQRDPSVVHIPEQPGRFLAPWNVRHQLARAIHTFQPVAYHFHDLRLRRDGMVQLYRVYRIGDRARAIYDDYLRDLRVAVSMLQDAGIPIPYQIGDRSLRRMLGDWWLQRTGRMALADLHP